jgi:uncharacterized repeat protein (TIGR01451 family)
MHVPALLRFLLVPSIILILVAAARAQAPPPLPARGPNPLLYVRFDDRPGMRVTFYQGQVKGRAIAAPVTAGLRPGYIYRVRLSELPGWSGVTLYPTLEVRGSLNLPPKLNAADYPAPIVLTEQDLERVQAGALVTKVIYLEHPERAIPNAASPKQLFETDVLPERDPLAMAREFGRPMLILRLGEREFTDQELAAQSVPGTILLPGDKMLGPPRAAPWVPWTCIPFYDPLLGPKPPEEECLHDGGDVGRKVSLDRNGQLAGIDPSDTVAEYADSHGRRSFAVSNRICLCVPRYAVIRAETPLSGYRSVVTPGDAQGVQGQVQLAGRVPSKQANQYEQPKAVLGRQRPSAAFGTQGVDRILHLEVLHARNLDIGPATALGTAAIHRLTDVERTRLAKQMEFARVVNQPYGPQAVIQTQTTSVVGRVEGLDVVSAVAETRDLSCASCEEPRPPDRPLVLCKWADRQAAQVGDVVTFNLKYSNLGGQPITDVAVTDSLTGRLEYVPGSAQSDRNAVFTTQPNESGSVILRWEISGRLLPGESGVVRFQARVR